MIKVEIVYLPLNFCRLSALDPGLCSRKAVEFRSNGFASLNKMAVLPVYGKTL